MMKCLTKEQLEGYKRDGFVVLDILKDSEVNELSKEYDAIFTKQTQLDTEATWEGSWNKQKTKTEVFSIHALQLYSAVYTKFLLHERVLDALEDILGTSNIILHHTKAHNKPPGTGSPFPMHQDYHFFPHEKDSMVAVFICLDDADTENGGLCVHPGSHKLGPQKDCSDSSFAHYVDQKKFPIEKATPVTLKRGQVLIFSYLLVHGSYNNNSKRSRRMYLMQIHAGEDKPVNAETVTTRPCQCMVLRGERTAYTSAIWRPEALQEKINKKMKTAG